MQPRRSLANPQPMNNQYSQALYDQPNCDYDPVKNFQDQNFGNPYDCPEGMYGGSMMSSVGYSQVNGGPGVDLMTSKYRGHQATTTTNKDYTLIAK